MDLQISVAKQLNESVCDFLDDMYVILDDLIQDCTQEQARTVVIETVHNWNNCILFVNETLKYGENGHNLLDIEAILSELGIENVGVPIEEVIEQVRKNNLESVG